MEYLGEEAIMILSNIMASKDNSVHSTNDGLPLVVSTYTSRISCAWHPRHYRQPHLKRYHHHLRARLDESYDLSY